MSERGDQGNVLPIRTFQGSGGNSGGSNDIRERLARLEEQAKHLATKEDVQKIKVWVLVGIIGALPGLVAMVLFVAKYFVN